jgi:hypothetical protein
LVTFDHACVNEECPKGSIAETHMCYKDKWIYLPAS